MILHIILLGIILIVYLFYKYHIHIDIPSFFRKGVNINDGVYGTYVFFGKQGSGKTASVVKFITYTYPKLPLYSNLKSYKGRKYTYISSLDELLKLKVSDCIIFYDELFTEITKNTRHTEDALAFLAQMRKRHIIFITTVQEWLELPMWLRRFVRFDIKCKTFSLFGKGILLEQYENAEEMKWSKDDNEYLAPVIAFKISKYNKRVVEMYDTWEVIGKLKDVEKSAVART